MDQSDIYMLVIDAYKWPRPLLKKKIASLYTTWSKKHFPLLECFYLPKGKKGTHLFVTEIMIQIYFDLKKYGDIMISKDPKHDFREITFIDSKKIVIKDGLINKKKLKKHTNNKNKKLLLNYNKLIKLYKACLFDKKSLNINDLQYSMNYKKILKNFLDRFKNKNLIPKNEYEEVKHAYKTMNNKQLDKHLENNTQDLTNLIFKIYSNMIVIEKLHTDMLNINLYVKKKY